MTLQLQLLQVATSTSGPN